jgi:hypothetical protein
LGNREIGKLAETAAKTLIKNHEINPKDKVAIVTDKKVPRIIVEAFYNTLSNWLNPDQEYFLSLAIIPPPKYPGEEPSCFWLGTSRIEGEKSLSENFLPHFDVAFLLTSVSITHITGSKKIQEKPNGYVISIPGMVDVDTAKAILKTISIDPNEIKKVNDSLSRAIGNGPNEVRITSDAGTNLSMKVPKGNWKSEDGCRKPDLHVTNGVAGEYFTAPIPGTTNGVLVIPAGSCLTTPIGMITEEIKLTIAGGLVTEIVGKGKQAQTLRKMLEAARAKMIDSSLKKAVMQIAEFSFGTNAKAPREGKSILVEKSLGTIHLAIGSNDETLTEGYPPDNPPKNVGIHIDCIIKNATVEIDGKIILAAGKLQI